MHPSEELLCRVQSTGEDDVDRFDGITDDDAAQEDVAGLQTDSNHDKDDTVNII